MTLVWRLARTPLLGLEPKVRTPEDHINIRILPTMISGIPPLLGLWYLCLCGLETPKTALLLLVVLRARTSKRRHSGIRSQETVPAAIDQWRGEGGVLLRDYWEVHITTYVFIYTFCSSISFCIEDTRALRDPLLGYLGGARDGPAPKIFPKRLEA